MPLGTATSSETFGILVIVITSEHVGQQFPAGPNLLGLVMGHDAFRGRQDEHAEVLRREEPALPLLELLLPDRVPGLHNAAVVYLAVQRDAELAAATVLDGLVALYVARFLHNLEHAGYQFRGGPYYAIALAGLLGVL